MTIYVFLTLFLYENYGIIFEHSPFNTIDMKLLLLSNSTNPGESYLDYPKKFIKEFLGGTTKNIVFIPYAAVTFSFDEYESKVNERFKEIGQQVTSLHRFENRVNALKSADAIIIGGGNTFHLLRELQSFGLLGIIREKVINGIPYIGWSAGSNMACPTICTTNDMPIVETKGLKALDLIPFQINPHYTDFVPAGFGGETRDQRISEFLTANPNRIVVGLREGTIFWYENDHLNLIGPHNAKIFKYKEVPYELTPNDDFNFLIK